MALTAAERQQARRRRVAERIVTLESMLADRDATIGDLRARLSAALDGHAAANEEIERLAALACRHPAAAVDGGRCLACGSDVW